jgi:hypothetical protein
VHFERPLVLRAESDATWVAPEDLAAYRVLLRNDATLERFWAEKPDRARPAFYRPNRRRNHEAGLPVASGTVPELSANRAELKTDHNVPL